MNELKNILNPRNLSIYITVLFTVMMLFPACDVNSDIVNSEHKADKNAVNYQQLPLFDSNGNIQAVIEIPAGTSHKIEIDHESNSFKTDLRNGKERVIEFLPYPANYGFIAGTLSDKALGGDGDAVDVFVIAEHLKTGTVLAVEPIAMLKLIDDGEEDFKIIAVPVNDELNVLKLKTLNLDQPKDKAILEMFEKWLLSYDTDPAKILGWANKEETLEYIKNNVKK